MSASPAMCRTSAGTAAGIRSAVTAADATASFCPTEGRRGLIVTAQATRISFLMHIRECWISNAKNAHFFQDAVDSVLKAEFVCIRGCLCCNGYF